MSDGIPGELKRFVFTSKININGHLQEEKLEIIIPELLQASYSFYTWPSAPVLAWFLWEHRTEINKKNILEIGSGTALPGIVAAKCGAKVTLSDSVTLPKSLSHIERSCSLNNLKLDKNIRLIGLTWGLFLNNFDNLGPVDYILGSDCFYEPSVFEDILVTISYIVDQNPGAKFLCTYQERSSDWTIESLLTKWNLKCQVHSINNLGSSAGFDIHKLIVRQIPKIFVGNLPWTIGSNELKYYFSKFGHVQNAQVIFDRSTGLSRNFGFVIFSTKQSLDNVIKENPHVLEGSTLKVDPTN